MRPTRTYVTTEKAVCIGNLYAISVWILFTILQGIQTKTALYVCNLRHTIKMFQMQPCETDFVFVCFVLESETKAKISILNVDLNSSYAILVNN